MNNRCSQRNFTTLFNKDGCFVSLPGLRLARSHHTKALDGSSPFKTEKFLSSLVCYITERI